MNQNRKNARAWIDHVYSEWLGKWDRARIRPAILELILELRSAVENLKKLDDSWRLIEELEKLHSLLYNETLTHSKEPPQMMLECGLAADRLGDSREATRLLKKATYTDPHDSAVARWLLGCVYWHLDDETSALTAWEKSMEVFRELENRTLKNPERTSWYHMRVKEMGEALKQAVENHVVPPIPVEQRPPQLRIADMFGSLPIIDEIPARTNLKVFGDGVDLIRTTRIWLDSQEFKIVSLLPKENPLSFPMGQRFYILKVQGNSMNKADPQPVHNGDYVIIRQQRRAQNNDIVVAEITDGENRDAHAILKRLIRLGEKMYLVPESTDPRYTRQIEFLDCLTEFGVGFQIHGVALALLKLVPESVSADGAGNAGNPEPSPTQASPSSQVDDQVDRYQYLCILVGGEKNIADGLIEFERERHPHASRDELIECAIERLLRDRR